ncbi:actin nucleation-promoting factor WASL-like [Anolis carolinensis]|uniref:actin nucleation-promoting factor WASL-like n=1 Tax=Anolis carolinensis TaxID=28377 RepID=UPI002F2B4CCB
MAPPREGPSHASSPRRPKAGRKRGWPPAPSRFPFAAPLKPGAGGPPRGESQAVGTSPSPKLPAFSPPPAPKPPAFPSSPSTATEKRICPSLLCQASGQRNGHRDLAGFSLCRCGFPVVQAHMGMLITRLDSSTCQDLGRWA